MNKRNRTKKESMLECYIGEGSPEAIAKLMLKLYGKVTPKQRTLHEVHAIWFRAKERLERNRKIFSGIIREIAAAKKADKQGNIYFHLERGAHVVRYRFSYIRELDSYSYSSDCVDNDNTLSRAEIIEKFTDLNTDKLVELAERFDLYNKLTLSHMSGKVYDIMWNLIEEKLNHEFRNKFEYFTKTITVKIQEQHYYIEVESHGNGWVQYKWKGVCDQNTIEL